MSGTVPMMMMRPSCWIFDKEEAARLAKLRDDAALDYEEMAEGLAPPSDD